MSKIGNILELVNVNEGMGKPFIMITVQGADGKVFQVVFKNPKPDTKPRELLDSKGLTDFKLIDSQSYKGVFYE